MTIFQRCYPLILIAGVALAHTPIAGAGQDQPLPSQSAGAVYGLTIVGGLGGGALGAALGYALWNSSDGSSSDSYINLDEPELGAILFGSIGYLVGTAMGGRAGLKVAGLEVDPPVLVGATLGATAIAAITMGVWGTKRDDDLIDTDFTPYYQGAAIGAILGTATAGIILSKKSRPAGGGPQISVQPGPGGGVVVSTRIRF